MDALAEVFVADGPRPELAEQLSLFAPLMGSWALRVFEYEPDGTVMESSAEWHFGWALDGRAVADVWINPSRADRGPDTDGEWGCRCGSTIRRSAPGGRPGTDPSGAG